MEVAALVGCRPGREDVAELADLLALAGRGLDYQQFLMVFGFADGVGVEQHVSAVGRVDRVAAFADAGRDI